MIARNTLATLFEQQIDCVKFQMANGNWDFEEGSQLRHMTKRTVTLVRIVGQFDEQLKEKLYLQVGYSCETYLNCFIREMGHQPRTKCMLWSRTNMLVDWIEEYFSDQDKQDIDDMMMSIWGEEKFGKIDEEDMFDLLAGFVVGKMSTDREAATK